MRTFVSYDWDELDPDGDYYDEEVILSNTYLNIVNNKRIEGRNDAKVIKPKTNERSSKSHVKWVDYEINKNLSIEIPILNKTNTGLPFVNLGDIESVNKSIQLNEKSIPVSAYDSDEASSVAIPFRKDYSIKGKFSVRKIPSLYKNPQTIAQFMSLRSIEKTRRLSEISRKSGTLIKADSDNPYVQSMRTVYDHFKVPGKTKSYKRNINPVAFSLKGHAVNLEEK
jgi:hypothetical protein